MLKQKRNRRKFFPSTSGEKCRGKRNIQSQKLSTLVVYVYVCNGQSYLATNTQRHVISHHILKIFPPLRCVTPPPPPPLACPCVSSPPSPCCCRFQGRSEGREEKAFGSGNEKRSGSDLPPVTQQRSSSNAFSPQWRKLEGEWLWKIWEGNNIFQGRLGKFYYASCCGIVARVDLFVSRSLLLLFCWRYLVVHFNLRKRSKLVAECSFGLLWIIFCSDQNCYRISTAS